jgi:hypothetical protein
VQVGGSLLFILHYYYRRLTGFAFRKGMNPEAVRESPKATDNSVSSLAYAISISPESAARYGIPMVAAKVRLARLCGSASMSMSCIGGCGRYCEESWEGLSRALHWLVPDPPACRPPCPGWNLPIRPPATPSPPAPTAPPHQCGGGHGRATHRRCLAERRLLSGTGADCVAPETICWPKSFRYLPTACTPSFALVVPVGYSILCSDLQRPYPGVISLT